MAGTRVGSTCFVRPTDLNRAGARPRPDKIETAGHLPPDGASARQTVAWLSHQEPSL